MLSSEIRMEEALATHSTALSRSKNLKYFKKEFASYRCLLFYFNFYMCYIIKKIYITEPEKLKATNDRFIY